MPYTPPAYMNDSLNLAVIVPLPLVLGITATITPTLPISEIVIIDPRVAMFSVLRGGRSHAFLQCYVHLQHH